MLSHFDRIPGRDGRTDRRNCYINIARQCAEKVKEGHTPKERRLGAHLLFIGR